MREYLSYNYENIRLPFNINDVLLKEDNKPTTDLLALDFMPFKACSPNWIVCKQGQSRIKE